MMKKAFTVLLFLSLVVIAIVILTQAYNQIFGKLLIALCAAIIATSVMKIMSSKTTRK